MSHKEIKTRFTRLFGLFVWETFVCITKPERHNKTKHNFALFFQFLVLRYLFLEMVIKEIHFNNRCKWYLIIYNINQIGILRKLHNLTCNIWIHFYLNKLHFDHTQNLLSVIMHFLSRSQHESYKHLMSYNNNWDDKLINCVSLARKKCVCLSIIWLVMT